MGKQRENNKEKKRTETGSQTMYLNKYVERNKREQAE